jgi:hypothetical protein
VDPVEELAACIHNAYREDVLEHDYYGSPSPPWSEVVELSRDRYRRVARRLLADPPSSLLKHLKELENSKE